MRMNKKSQQVTYMGRTLITTATGEVEVNGRRFDSSLVARMAIDAGLV